MKKERYSRYSGLLIRNKPAYDKVRESVRLAGLSAKAYGRNDLSKGKEYEQQSDELYAKNYYKAFGRKPIRRK